MMRQQFAVSAAPASRLQTPRPLIPRKALPDGSRAGSDHPSGLMHRSTRALASIIRSPHQRGRTAMADAETERLGGLEVDQRLVLVGYSSPGSSPFRIRP